MTAIDDTFSPRRRSRRPLAALGLAAALLGGLANLGPAQAQGYYGQPVLGPRGITALLGRQGFSRMSLPVLNRDVYVLDAIDPYGQPMRVIVGAFDGRILAAHPQRGRAGVFVDPDDEDDDEPPVHRRGRQGRDWAHAPSDPFAGERWPQPEPEHLQPLPDEPPPPQRPSARRAPTPAPVPQRESSGGLTPLPPPPPASEKFVPAPTPKSPTVVKRSPTAIPRDGTATPGVGTREKPRVIELAPSAPPPLADVKPAPSTAAVPQPKVTQPQPVPTPPAPPPAAATPAPTNPAPQMPSRPEIPATLAPPPAVMTTPNGGRPVTETPRTEDGGRTVRDYRALPPATFE